MGLVETIAITVVAFTTVDAIKKGSVPLGFSALTVLLVFLLVVSLFDFHSTNIINCWGGGI